MINFSMEVMKMITPDWYWVHGLHDAKICSVSQIDIPYDPSQKIPDNNCLIIKMNCDGAMFERNITEIRFYNFKVLTRGFDLNILNGGWWLSDELTQKGEQYLLKLRFDTEKCKTKRLKLRFGRAEVIRKSNICDTEKFTITEVEKDGYVFFVDKDKTSQYYTMHSLCDCCRCQNFYKQIKGLFPDLEKFLSEFGIDISRPDELMWYDIDNYIQYHSCYTVTGSIEISGKHKIDFGNLTALFYQGANPIADIPNEQTELYFVIEISNIDLPWVLDTLDKDK